MSVLESLVSLFAPNDCLGCGREGSLACQACRASLPPLLGRCFGCYALVSGVACSDCLQRQGLSSLSAAAQYSGLAKALVAQLKFYGSQSAAYPMAQAMLALGQLPSSALLVHIPATAAHIRGRGYDQAELLVKQIARQTGCRRLAALARSGAAHQLGADRSNRLQQLATALRVRNAALVHGRHIILVDDVITTGASLRAAATALRVAGAQRVDAITFAQA